MYDTDIQKGVIVKSDMTYINIALNTGLDEKAFPFPKVFSFVCLAVHCCSCFSLDVRLYPPVSALPPQYLSEINFFVTTHVNEVKPREMLNNYTTRKLCHFEVIWLKRFFCFVCYCLRNCAL